MDRSVYQEAISQLTHIKPSDDDISGYRSWIYELKRSLLAERYGKTELQVEADVKALIESREGRQ